MSLRRSTPRRTGLLIPILGMLVVLFALPSSGLATSSTGATVTTQPAGSNSCELYVRWSMCVWAGPDGIPVSAAFSGNTSPAGDISGRVTAVAAWSGAEQRWHSYYPGYDDIPGANDFTLFTAATGYWIAITDGPSVTWTPSVHEGPVSVVPQKDEARSVSATIDAGDGGTLSTLAADGTAFTLTIPAGALLSDTTVTMTPYTSLGSLPLSGGLVGGVDLTPDGLVLLETATLDIVPPGYSFDPSHIAFTFMANGSEVHATPMAADPSILRLYLNHFSGWAVGSGTETERQAMFESTVQSDAAKVSQKIAAPLDAARRGDLSQDEVVDAYTATAMEAYATVVVPAMNRAETLAEGGARLSDVTGDVATWIGWDRMLVLLGVDALAAERLALYEQAARILDLVFDSTFDRCVDENDPAEIEALIAVMRTISLLGMDPDEATMNDRLEKCARFELDFEIHVTGTGLSGFWHHVRALNVPLRPSDTGLLAGEAPNEYVAVGATYACWDLQPSFEGVFRAEVLRLDVQLGTDSTDTARQRDWLVVSLDPAEVRERWASTCPSPWTTIERARLFGLTWDLLRHYHPDAHELGEYALTNWEFVGSSLWARKTSNFTYVNSQDSSLQHTENLTVEIWHRPTR